MLHFRITSSYCYKHFLLASFLHYILSNIVLIHCPIFNHILYHNAMHVTLHYAMLHSITSLYVTIIPVHVVVSRYVALFYIVPQFYPFYYSSPLQKLKCVLIANHNCLHCSITRCIYLPLPYVFAPSHNIFFIRGQ